jgi:thiol-disulfide isomerase/thioredoxin
MIVLLVAVASAADPTASITWKKGDGSLVLGAAPGEHLSPDAPFSVSLTWADGSVAVSGLGSALEDGVDLPDLRGREVAGTLSASICDDAGTTCMFGEWAVSGVVPDQKKGAVALKVGAPVAASHGLGGMGRDAAVAARDAFSEAARTNKLVLLDFGAVWCPPCNMLAGEVLSDPEAIDGFVLVTLDVDDRSSFALKDQYKVGGYPTVVATDAKGVEVGRTVGYDGRPAFEGWLASVRSGRAALPTDPASVDAARAGEVAWALVQQDREEVAGPWLAVAADGVPTRLARLAVDHRVEDLQWLLDQGVPVRDYMFHALAVSLDDATRLALRDRVVAALAGASAVDAANLAWVVGELSPGDPSWFLAAAAMLRAQLKGEPMFDKGVTSELISALDQGGAEVEALALARDFARRYPNEMTFHLAEARLLLALDRPAEALAAAERGLAVSLDDNHLRVAEAAARALVALGRADDARALVDKTLATIPAPADGLAVRSNRYRKALAAVVAPPEAASR